MGSFTAATFKAFSAGCYGGGLWSMIFRLWYSATRVFVLIGVLRGSTGRGNLTHCKIQKTLIRLSESRILNINNLPKNACSASIKANIGDVNELAK